MQKSVEINSCGLTLRGMLHIPDGTSKILPAVIIYHGFTGNKMEPHFIFVKLSRVLESMGIASVRFDFGCSGESDGDFENMTPETELLDAKAILEYIKGLDFIDDSRIGICGLSLGGYIGGITAGDNKELVKALCMWAPAGNIDQIYKTRFEGFQRLDEGLFDIGGLILNPKVYESVLNIDYLGRTAVFDKPSCIIHGNNDLTVPYEVGLKYKDALKNVEFHTIEGADHTFNGVMWEREVLDITTKFFKREL